MDCRTLEPGQPRLSEPPALSLEAGAWSVAIIKNWPLSHVTDILLPRRDRLSLQAGDFEIALQLLERSRNSVCHSNGLILARLRQTTILSIMIGVGRNGRISCPVLDAVLN